MQAVLRQHQEALKTTMPGGVMPLINTLLTDAETVDEGGAAAQELAEGAAAEAVGLTGDAPDQLAQGGEA